MSLVYIGKTPYDREVVKAEDSGWYAYGQKDGEVIYVQNGVPWTLQPPEGINLEAIMVNLDYTVAKRNKPLWHVSSYITNEERTDPLGIYPSNQTNNSYRTQDPGSCVWQQLISRVALTLNRNKIIQKTKYCRYFYLIDYILKDIYSSGYDAVLSVICEWVGATIRSRDYFLGGVTPWRMAEIAWGEEAFPPHETEPQEDHGVVIPPEGVLPEYILKESGNKRLALNIHDPFRSVWESLPPEIEAKFMAMIFGLMSPDLDCRKHWRDKMTSPKIKVIEVNGYKLFVAALAGDIACIIYSVYSDDRSLREKTHVPNDYIDETIRMEPTLY